MKILIVACVAVAALVYVSANGAAPAPTCRTGEAQGFAAIRWNPEGTIGQLVGKSSSPRWFWRRYNCTGRGVSIRRLDRGVYDIDFPGLGNRLAVVSAISQEGVSASVQPFGTGLFRVTLRGPIVDENLLTRRDIPFTIVVF